MTLPAVFNAMASQPNTSDNSDLFDPIVAQKGTPNGHYYSANRPLIIDIAYALRDIALDNISNPTLRAACCSILMSINMHLADNKQLNTDPSKMAEISHEDLPVTLRVYVHPDAWKEVQTRVQPHASTWSVGG